MSVVPAAFSGTIICHFTSSRYELSFSGWFNSDSRPQRWNQLFFEKTTLKEMGLRVQLGHMVSVCLVPRPGHKDFIVLHTNGLHYVAVDFCGCDHRITSRQQLLRIEWYPATVHYPQTCATYRLLELFHTVTLTGKLSAHEFYKALEHLTDNTGLNVPKVSRAFLCMIKIDVTFSDTL